MLVGFVLCPPHPAQKGYSKAIRFHTAAHLKMR